MTEVRRLARLGPVCIDSTSIYGADQPRGLVYAVSTQEVASRRDVRGFFFTRRGRLIWVYVDFA